MEAAKNSSGGLVPAQHQQPVRRPINAEHLMLALVARRAVPARRWAALSDGATTNACSQRCGHYSLRTPPLMVPMDRGGMHSVVERTRLLHGLPEVRRVWGTGLRAMLAETSGVIL
jgi:hypothetical protein